ncbi:MAG: transposase [Dehalococcoidia bacterium]
MVVPADCLAPLRAVRADAYTCLGRRRAALFELSDALLSGGPTLSPVHLSLEPVHRRGWGSLSAALAQGSVEVDALRRLLAGHALRDGAPPIFAVDVSGWPRGAAEASPDRGSDYHPSRHAAGQPIVTGWAYQWIAQLSLTRDS